MHRKIRINAIPIITLCTVLAVIIAGYGFSGCSNGSNDAKFTSLVPDTTTPNPATSDTTPSGISTPDTATQATTGITLSWDAPTTYTDGSPLTANQLKEYRIYFRTQSGTYSPASYHPVYAPTTSAKVRDVISVGTGTYCFVVTAVATLASSTVESDPSNEVSKYLQ